MVWFGKNHLRDALAYGLAYTSHCILDFATTVRGNGVELFFPFTTERFGLRWFGLSEIPSQLSAAEILKTIGLEFLIFAPLLAVALWLRTSAISKTEQ